MLNYGDFKIAALQYHANRLLRSILSSVVLIFLIHPPDEGENRSDQLISLFWYRRSRFQTGEDFGESRFHMVGHTGIIRQFDNGLGDTAFSRSNYHWCLVLTWFITQRRRIFRFRFPCERAPAVVIYIHKSTPMVGCREDSVSRKLT